MRKLAYNGKEPQLRGVKTRLYCRTEFYLDVNKDCKIIGISRKDLQKRRDNAEKDAEKERKKVEAGEKTNPLEKKSLKVLSENVEKRADALQEKVSNDKVSAQDPLESQKSEISGQVAIQIPEEQNVQQANVKFNLLSPYKLDQNEQKNINNNSTNDGLAGPTGLDVGVNPGVSRLKGKLEKNRSLTSASSSANIQKQVQINDRNPNDASLCEETNSNSVPENEAIFYLIPVGLRIVAIQHADTGLYIAMDPEGKLYTCEMFTAECKFKEACVENYYVVYSSVQYKHPKKNQRPLHIGLNPKGRVTRGTKATKTKHCTHFLPEPIEVVMMREPSSYEIVGAPSRSTTVSNNNLAAQAGK